MCLRCIRWKVKRPCDGLIALALAIDLQGTQLRAAGPKIKNRGPDDVNLHAGLSRLCLQMFRFLAQEPGVEYQFEN